MEINEKSKVSLEVDGVIVDRTFHDANDAWQKGINKILQGSRKAVVKEVVTIEKV